MKKSHRMLHLFEYLRGNLSSEDARQLEEQIASSKKMKNEFDESKRLFDALQSLAADKPAIDGAFTGDAMRSIKQSIPEVEGYMKGSTIVRGFVGAVALAVVLWIVLRGEGRVEFASSYFNLFIVNGGIAWIAFAVLLVAAIFVLRRQWRLSATFVSAALALFIGHSVSMREVASVLHKPDTDSPAYPQIVEALRRSVPVVSPVEKQKEVPKGYEKPEVNQQAKVVYQPNRVAEATQDMSVEDSRMPSSGAHNDLVAGKNSAASGALSRDRKMIGAQETHLLESAAALPERAIASAPVAIDGSWGRGTGFPLLDREGYGQYDENPRTNPLTTPLSTFSIDVDTGSYSNMRRFLSRGKLPPKDSVRLEEFVNYFDYNYESSSSQPFSVNFELAPSPLDREYHLLRVGIKARTIAPNSEMGWNLVFLIDVSGSMNEPTKLPLVKESLKLLAASMRPIDRVALVTYAGSAGMVLDSTPGSERAKIDAAIDSLGAGGGTNGSGGIELAYQVAQRNMIKGSVNRVILATDGDFNVGVSSFDGLMSLIETKRKSGITLTTLGFGEGNIQERTMEQLANRGNGNYYYIDTFREARKVLETGLSATMQVVAKDVKLQMEFNPAVVKQYRLIGFDNRKLNREDFNNDAKDAGEIGAGHTVTALYEIVLTDSPLAKKLNDELRYRVETPTPAAEIRASELGFLKVRYKEPESEVSQPLSFPIAREILKSKENASSDFNFAAAVAYFGEILRESQFVGSYTLDDVVAIARKNRGADEAGTRAEFIKLAEDARSLKKN